MSTQKGIYHKYTVTHADGSPVDGQCFVLKLSDPAARRALMAYALAVEETNPQLSTDIALMIRNHNQNHELPAPTPTFCWSEDGEAFHGDEPSVEAAIADGVNCLAEVEPLERICVGQIVPARELIPPDQVGDQIRDFIQDFLYDEVGEANNNLVLSPEQAMTLGQVVIDWLDLQNFFKCYGVKNVRRYRVPFDPTDQGEEVRL